VKGVRFWSAVMALTWFLAGLGAGYLISSRQAEPGAWEGYADEIQSTFNLPSLERSVLNQLLEQHSQKLNEIKRRHTAETREAMEPELRALFYEIQRTISDTIIPPDQREHFQEMCLPRSVLTSES
jgi:uncharacterized membrane protein